MNQPNPMDAQEFQNRLMAMEPGQRDQMMKVLSIIASPPETLVTLFDRLSMKWERKYVGREGEYPYGALVVDWREFMKAEKENQTQGPVLKRLLTEEFQGVASEEQIDEAVAIRPPEMFVPKPMPNNTNHHDRETPDDDPFEGES